MSRKHDVLNKKYGNFDESESQDFREDFYQPSQQDEIYDEEEEIVDISAFGLEYQAQQSEAQSEEAKKVAELMASISAENAAEKAAKGKKEKKKRDKKKKREKKSKLSFETFADVKEEFPSEEDEPLNKSAVDGKSVDSKTDAIDDIYDNALAEEEYEDTYFDEEDDFSVEPSLPEELDDDFAIEKSDENNLADDVTDDEYSEIEYEEEYDEDSDSDDTEKYSYEEIDEEPIDEEDNTDDTEVEYGDEEESENNNDEKKSGFLHRIRAFWSGSEDFEEKFGDDFDVSVFDEEEPSREIADEEAEEQPQKGSEDGSESDSKESAQTQEEPELDEETDEDTEEYEFDSEKSMSIFGKLKAFWNGEDIKRKSIDDEEVTEEEIDAEVEAEKSEWIKSSVKYDDLSEYAPKQRDKVQSEEGVDEFDYDEDYTISSKKGIFDVITDRVKSFLRPSLGENEDLLPDEEFDEEQSEALAENDEEEEQSEEIKKASPIEQIKKLWNEDDSYADEDDQNDEDDEPIDAEYIDESEKPVVTKPVLTVIDPSQPIDADYSDDNDKTDEIEDQAQTDDDDTEPEIASEAYMRADEAVEAEAEDELSEQITDDSDDDIIAEGPDKPVDVVVSATYKKKGLLGRLKSFWNGGSFKQGGIGDGLIDDNIKAEDTDESKLEAEKSDSEEKTENADEKTEGEIQDNTEEVTVDSSEREVQPVVAVTAQEAAAEMKAEPTTFDEVAQEVQIDSVDGRQVVNGKVVPKYIHEDLVEKISLTNENLPFVVRREYEEYIRQAKYRPNLDGLNREMDSEVSKAVREEMNNPEKAAENLRLRKEKAEAEKKADDTAEKQQSKSDRKSIKDVLFGDVENSADFSEFRAQTNLNPQNDQVIEDYDKPSDARAIRAEINYDNRKVSFRCITLAVIFAITLGLYVIQRYFPTVLTLNIPNADIMTCLISLILLIISAVLCHSTIIGGLKPLLAFKGNSDTAVAVAVVGCLAQGVVSFFEPQAFFSGGMHLYAILAIVALLFNNLGKLCIVQRIKANFKFVSSPNRKYAARVYEDEEISQQMIDKTNAEKPIVALQSRTRFLKGFLRFSYMPDPSERAASFMAPITTVIAVLIAIICGISNGTVASSISAFTIVACMSIPMCCLLAVNIPMKKLCKDSLRNRAMIIGYPAVKTFSETRAVMVDSRELYPRGKVQLLSVKTFNTYNIDKALLNAAAVMKIANTPMTYMFEDVISEKGEQLPEVESVKYEDGKGLVSWVGGERLLLGNRDLMKKYSINLPSLDFEESSVESRSNCITYLANAGQLVAMLVTDYQADPRLAAELKRLEKNGVTILIRTADPNVSQLKVAKDFGVFIRSIKILPTTLGNICKDEMSKREDSSRAFISTEGKLHSLARAISGCIKIKDNISIAIVIQVIAVVLGVLIAAVVSVFSGLNGLHGIDLLFYVIFWAAASIIAPLIQKA